LLHDLKEVKLLDYKTLAKEKTFRIIINPKATKKTAGQKKIQEVLQRYNKEILVIPLH